MAPNQLAPGFRTSPVAWSPENRSFFYTLFDPLLFYTLRTARLLQEAP
jgi:hypothetical protein